MPERHKAATAITESFTGTHVWDGLTGTCRTMPTDAFNAAHTAADTLWCHLVGTVDWSRVLLEAFGRCLALGHTHGTDTTWADDGPCGPSVLAALLTDRTHTDWDGTSDTLPHTPDRDAAMAACQTLADATTYRRAN